MDLSWTPGVAQEVYPQVEEENLSHQRRDLSEPFWQVAVVVSGDLSKWG